MQVEKPQTENDEYLQQKLRDLKNQEGIIGYILRGTKSAAIDLKDPKKIIEYAVLSSTVFDESQTMTNTLQLGNIETIVVESEDTKLLSMNLEDTRITIFMEKSVDHNKLYEDMN